jgi:hypothetical protein
LRTLTDKEGEIPQSRREEEEFWRGHEAGSKEQSAAEMGAEIVSRFIQSAEYVAGCEQGQADRATGKA